MKRKFKPYLDIKDKKQLQLLLNRQNSIEENYFDLSEIKECSVEAFKEAVVRIKNFYGYTPKGEDVEFIDELIYHLIIIQVYINSLGLGMYIQTAEATNEEELGKIFDNFFEDEDTFYLEFLANEIKSINKFIAKYYGQDFYEIDINSVEDIKKLNIDQFCQLLNKVRAVVLIIGNFTKNFRLKMLIFNIVHFTFKRMMPEPPIKI